MNDPVVDTPPEVLHFLPHQKCSFPGQHVIGTDRVLYKDDEVVGPIMQSFSQWLSQQASQWVQQAAIELDHKLYVTVNCLVFIFYLSHQASSSSYKIYNPLKSWVCCENIQRKAWLFLMHSFVLSLLYQWLGVNATCQLGGSSYAGRNAVVLPW